MQNYEVINNKRVLNWSDFDELLPTNTNIYYFLKPDYYLISTFSCLFSSNAFLSISVPTVTPIAKPTGIPNANNPGILTTTPKRTPNGMPTAVMPSANHSVL